MSGQVGVMFGMKYNECCTEMLNVHTLCCPMSVHHFTTILLVLAKFHFHIHVKLNISIFTYRGAKM